MGAFRRWVGRCAAGAAALLGASGVLCAPPAAAQDPPPAAPAAALPVVESVGIAPLPGSGLPRDQVPGNPRGLSAADLARLGRPSLPDALERLSASVNLNESQSNPFQPDLQYRGFTASPLLGTPQGLAVYQNGVRINEAFGDTVNWDLIPEIAIRGVDLLGSNPLFGLNAIGGALAIRMRTGFDFQGAELDLSGGSHGRRALRAQAGKQVGDVAGYLAVEGLDDDGWRQRSPSRVRRLWGDLGFRGERATLNLSLGAGSNVLTGNGPAPVQLLAANRNAVFTFPDRTSNRLLTLQARGSYAITDALSLEANAYVRSFRQRTLNADLLEAEGCEEEDLAGLLCLEDGPPLRGAGGAAIAEASLGGAPPGALNRTSTNTLGAGGAAQLVSRSTLLGLPARLVFGASYVHADTEFLGTSEFGAVTPDRTVAGLGPILDQPAGGIAPVRLNSTNAYYGIYGSGALDLTPRLSATLGGRFNLAEVTLRDRIGSALDGSHSFRRFNPQVGLTWRVTDRVTAYAGYAEANRAPTPAELSCADPLLPCTLGAFFLSDPPLRQVVSRTVEAGLRGAFPAAAIGLGGRVAWSLGLFRTDLEDDILLVQSEIQGRGFFRNAGDTRRQGAEASLGWRGDRLALTLDYALIDATFRTPEVLPSPNSPFADESGAIRVERGDRLPGIPRHRLRLGAEWRATEAWTLGGTLILNSSQHLRGDESNQVKPIAGYGVVNLRTTLRVGPGVELYGVVRNLLDQRYATFGTFYDLEVAGKLNLGLTDPRTVSPGLPRAFYGGLRIRF